jgi:hypothetical protein
MTSPNLAAPHVAAAQNQKEVTINDATDALDLAITASLSVDCSAGGTIAPTLTQARRNARFVLSGTPPAAFSFQIPNLSRLLVLRNTTEQLATLRNPTGSAVVDLGAGKQALVYSTGGNVFLVGASPTEVYDFGMLAFEPPEADAVLGKVVLPRAVVLPANLAGARGDVDTPPTASFEIRLSVNGANLGTITISEAGLFTFATAAGLPIALGAGAVVRFVAPPTPDAAIAGIAITLAGSLS